MVANQTGLALPGAVNMTKSPELDGRLEILPEICVGTAVVTALMNAAERLSSRSESREDAHRRVEQQRQRSQQAQRTKAYLTNDDLWGIVQVAEFQASLFHDTAFMLRMQVAGQPQREICHQPRISGAGEETGCSN